VVSARGRIRSLLPVAIALIAIPAAPLVAHPIHTSLAELVYDPSAKEIRISLRVYVDDLTKASASYSRGASADSAMISYARAYFGVVDRNGKLVSLASCGEKLVGDLMWLCFRGPARTGPSGFSVAHKVLFDLYSDQINLVQASYNGRKVSLLFTKGDGFKRLQ
jgi:hypothetical protein